jgi:HTH-type transcriptional regulator/antitoxin HigA
MTTRASIGAWSDLAVPPGETLRDELRARGLTQKELATRIGRPPQAINEIVRGRKAITAETALALEGVFEGISARFWLNLQADYELTLARIRRQAGPAA